MLKSIEPWNVSLSVPTPRFAQAAQFANNGFAKSRPHLISSSSTAELEGRDPPDLTVFFMAQAPGNITRLLRAADKGEFLGQKVTTKVAK